MAMRDAPATPPAAQPCMYSIDLTQINIDTQYRCVMPHIPEAEVGRTKNVFEAMSGAGHMKIISEQTDP